MNDTTSTEVEAEELEETRMMARMNWLRAWVLGANDGIVSTAALVVGVAAATNDRTALLAAGFAGIAAGALSMAVGEYVSVSSQRDAERAQLEREKKWHTDRPEYELEQLARLHMETGMDKATARAAAEQQTAHDPLAAHARAHLGIDPKELVNPWHAALASLVAFTLGGAIPVILVVLVDNSWQIPATYVAVILALILTGWSAAHLGKAGALRAILRNVAGGTAAMGITYLIGLAVGTAL
jgi:VIT1/CCC1 family predicted Fe2+/Mn2+ transporter